MRADLGHRPAPEQGKPALHFVGEQGEGSINARFAARGVHWTGWHGEPDYGNGAAGRPDATARPQNYEAMDATRQVERIKGQLLVIAGELDENCPLPPIMQFYAAAVEADAPVELVVLPNRNHYTLGRTHYTFRRMMDWICQHLLGQLPPKDFRFTVLPQTPEPDDRPIAW